MRARWPLAPVALSSSQSSSARPGKVAASARPPGFAPWFLMSRFSATRFLAALQLDLDIGAHDGVTRRRLGAVHCQSANAKRRLVQAGGRQRENLAAGLGD